MWNIAGTPVRVVAFDPALCKPQAGAPGGQTVGIAGTNMMVTSADVQASAAGCKVLARGGSAIDAAIAAQAVLGVAEPFASGLAGGTRHLLRRGGEEGPHVRGPVGRAGEHRRGDDDVDLPDGGDVGPELPLGPVDRRQHLGAAGQHEHLGPGDRRAGHAARPRPRHRAHGRLAWNTLWDDAIALANGGFPMTPYMYSTLYSDGTEFDDETGEPLERRRREGVVEHHARPLGSGALRVQGHQGALLRPTDPKGERPLAVGTLIRNPQLASTMALVRDGGADAFYDPNGAIAAAILQRFKDDKQKADGSNNCTSILPADLQRRRHDVGGDHPGAHPEPDGGGRLRELPRARAQAARRHPLRHDDLHPAGAVVRRRRQLYRSASWSGRASPR